MTHQTRAPSGLFGAGLHLSGSGDQGHHPCENQRPLQPTHRSKIGTARHYCPRVRVGPAACAPSYSTRSGRKSWSTLGSISPSMLHHTPHSQKRTTQHPRDPAHVFSLPAAAADQAAQRTDEAGPEVGSVLSGVGQGHIQGRLLLACGEVGGAVHADREHGWLILEDEGSPITLRADATRPQAWLVHVQEMSGMLPDEPW